MTIDSTASTSTKRRPKLARIATVPEAFVSIVGNLEEFQKSGFDVDIICSDGPFGKVLEAEHGFKVIVCDIPRGISLWRDLKSLANLVRIFKTRDYDIIHSHTPKAGLLSAVAGVLAFRKIRLHTFTGQRWVTLDQPLRGILRLFDKLIVALNTRCYADSPTQVEFLISQKVGKNYEVKCLGNGSFGGVDFGKFSPARRNEIREEISRKFDIPMNEPWSLFVGRIVRDKGIHELIAAHEQVTKTLPYQLVIIGTFEDGLDPVDLSVKKTILSNPSIHYLGFQSEPSTFMRAADFLCLPSYREGFGSVVIESAACGIPSIGTDIPGLMDAIVDGETGLLVPKGNISKLVKAISLFLSDADLRKRLGNAAEKRAHDKFDYRYMSHLQAQEYTAFLS